MDFEKVAGAPAEALERTIDTSRQIGKTISSHAHIKKAKAYWKTLGPGSTTGASDDDPSGIATYSQTGAQYGFGLLWLASFTFPLMAVVQEMCARIGLVTGRGLAANIRLYYPKWVLYLCTALLFGANSLNIGADLGAMAKASQLLLPSLNFEAMVLAFAFVGLALQIFTTYEKYAKYLKWLALILLSYIFSAISINMDWGQVLRSAVIPSITFSRDQIFLICAVLGTTISPYLFFWQTSQEVEEGILRGEVTVRERRLDASPRTTRRMRIDVWSGMFFSNLIAFFIFAACAGTLYTSGVTNIVTADQAAAALAPFGQFASLLFALGIVGTGLLAVPILAGSSAYAIAESMHWKYGLYRKLKQAYAFYGIIIVAMIIGVVANFLHLDPIRGLIWAAVANGLISPFVLFFVVRLSGSKRVMGEYVNRPLVSGAGWTTIGVMALSGVAAIATLL